MQNSARYKLELELFERTLFAQLFVQHIMDNVKIDESQIRQGYEEQPIQTLYRFMIWQTPSADLAAATLESLRNSDAALPEHPQVSKIETPWLMGTDIDPQVHQKVIALGINDFVDSPIHQDEVWKVVQLIDKRALARQSSKLERDIVRAEMVAENLEETLDALRARATIVVNEDYAADLNLH